MVRLLVRTIKSASELESVNANNNDEKAQNVLEFREPKNLTAATPNQPPEARLASAFYRHDGEASPLEVINIRIRSATLLHRGNACQEFATLTMSVDADSMDMLTEIDRLCLAAAVAQSGQWFQNKLPESAIVEFFSPCVTLDTGRDRRAGRSVVARLRLSTTASEVHSMIASIAPGDCYDVTLRLTGICFKKQHFWPHWKVTAATPIRKPPPIPSPATYDFQDSHSDDSLSSDEIAYPDPEDVADVTRRLSSRIANIRDFGRKLIDDIGEAESKLNGCTYRKLSAIDAVSKDLDEIEDKLTRQK